MFFLVLECVYVPACMRTFMCVCVGFCVCECMCVRACVWVCERMCVCVNLRREGRNNTSGQTCHFL